METCDSEYHIMEHRFGVFITTVCQYVQDFTTATETLLVPELIFVHSCEGFKEMAAYNENRCVLLLMDHTYLTWHFGRTILTISTGKAGSPSFFKELWMEKDFFGISVEDRLEASMTPGP